MPARYLMLLAASLVASQALADACHVTTRSSSAAVQEVETESCYELRGMPADSLDWSCRNESKQMLSTDKQRQPECARNYFASCTAGLTQETLANPRSTRDDPSAGAIDIPDDARIVTYYYEAADHAQLRKDCEQGGGRWQQHTP